MKPLSFEISKSKLVFIGIVFICLIFVLNRYRVWNQHDKVEGMYLDWTELFKKEENIRFLLPYFKHDTSRVFSVLSDIRSPYIIVYQDLNNVIVVRELDYTLKLKSGNKITILIHKSDRNEFKIFTFISFNTQH